MQQSLPVVEDAFLSVLQLAWHLLISGLTTFFIFHGSSPLLSPLASSLSLLITLSPSSFHLIIKKQFADINLQICLLAVSQFTTHSTDLETEARRSLVTTALQSKSVFNRTQGAALIFTYISLYISLYF